jgi:hypothetical protein
MSQGQKIDECFGYSTVIENDFQDYMWLFTSFSGVFDVQHQHLTCVDSWTMCLHWQLRGKILKAFQNSKFIKQRQKFPQCMQFLLLAKINAR